MFVLTKPSLYRAALRSFGRLNAAQYRRMSARPTRVQSLPHRLSVYRPAPPTASMQSSWLTNKKGSLKGAIAIVSELVDRGEFSEAEAVLDRMAKLNQFPYSAYLYILEGYGKSSMIEEMLGFFEKMQLVPLTVPRLIHFAAVIKHVSRLGDIEGALYHLDEMISSGIRPNTVIFNCLFDACEKFEALGYIGEILETMKHYNVPRDVITYTSICRAYGLAGLHRRALKVVQEDMVVDRVKPNSLTLLSLVQIFLRCGDVSMARLFLDRMRDNFPDDAKTMVMFQILELQILCIEGHPEAAQAIGLQLRHRGVLHPFAVSAILSASAKHSPASAFKTARTLLDAHSGVSLTAYNTILSIFSNRSDVASAEATFNLMISHGVSPNIASYNILASLYSRVEMLPKLEQILDDMARADVQPDIGTLSAVLTLLCKRGDNLHVERLRSQLSVCGTPLHPRIRGILALYYAKTGQLDQVCALVEEQALNGYLPTWQTLLSQIEAASYSKNLDEIHRLFDHLQGKLRETSRFNTTLISQTVIRSFVRAGDVESAAAAWLKLRNEFSFVPLPVAYKDIIRAFVQCGLVHRALDFAEDALETASFVPVHGVILRPLVLSVRSNYSSLAQTSSVFKAFKHIVAQNQPLSEDQIRTCEIFVHALRTSISQKC